MENWKYNNLRVTLFAEDSFKLKSNSFLKEIFDLNSSSYSEKNFGIESESISPWKSKNNILINTNANRVHIILKPNEEDNLTPIPLIANEEDVLSFFNEIRCWLVKQENIIRIAFSANSFFETRSIQESYSKLNSLISFCEINSDTMSEFKMQLNLPKNSTIIPGSKINRITTWQCLAVEIGAIFPDISSQKKLSENYFLNALTEINSDATKITKIPGESCSELLTSFIEETKSIINNGI